MTSKNKSAPAVSDDFPALRIETLPNGNLRLTDPGYDEHAVVDVHPAHLRVMAERLGLVRELSASEADMLRTERGRIAELRRENDRLKRNMLRLHCHSLALQHDFRKNADWASADLSFEMQNINGLVDLFDMAVEDFKDDYEPFDPVTGASVEEPAANPSVTQGKPNPNPGVSGSKPKGFVSDAEDPQISGATPPETVLLNGEPVGDTPPALPRSKCTPADTAPPQIPHPGPGAQLGLEV